MQPLQPLPEQPQPPLDQQQPQQQTPPPPPPTAQTSKQKDRNIWWTVVIVGLVVVGIALVYALVTGDSSGGSTTEPIVIPPTPIPGAATGTALEAVNIRTGPGTNYPSYGVVPAGSTGEIIGKSQDGQWWVVKISVSLSPSGQGWVSAQYILATGAENVPVINAPPPPPPVEVPPPASNAPSATALDSVYVRSGPGTNYPAYGVAPKGATGEVVGVSQDGKWWAVKLPTTVASVGYGWVSVDWVSTSNTSGVPVLPAPAPPPVVTPEPPATGAPTAVAMDYINVRSGPGEQYESYGVAPPGASAEILGKSQDGQWWAVKVLVVSSGRGWVSAAYVMAYNAQNVPVLTEP